MTDSLAVLDERGEPQAWVWRGTPAPSQPARRPVWQGKSLAELQAAGEWPEGTGSRLSSLAMGAAEEWHGAPRHAGARAQSGNPPVSGK